MDDGFEYPQDIQNTINASSSQQQKKPQSFLDKIKGIFPKKVRADINPYMEQLRAGQPVQAPGPQPQHFMSKVPAIPVIKSTLETIPKPEIPISNVRSGIDQLMFPEKHRLIKFLAKASGLGLFAIGAILVYNDLPGHLALVVGIICTCVSASILINSR